MITLKNRISYISKYTNSLFSDKKFTLFFILIISFSLSCFGNTTPSDNDEKNSLLSNSAYGKNSRNNDCNEVEIKDPAIRKAKENLIKWLNNHTGRGYNAPNAVLALLHKGKVIIKRAAKTTNDHLFNAASHSKFFTLLSILQLADKGLIDVDKPLSNYLDGDVTRPEIGSAPVTVRHVLSHTSGYRGGSKQVFRTGRGYYYSNPGYMLLSELIPTLTGKTLPEYIMENIIKPLGMPYADPEKINGAAHFRWSLEDMVILLKLVHGKGQYNGVRIISKKWFESEIYKPVRVGLRLAKNKSYRGICFRVSTIDDRPFLINHAALTPGSGGWFHYYPKHDIGFIIMTNSPTANLLDEVQMRTRGDKEKEKEEKAKIKKFLPPVHLDPYFGSWYFRFCRETYNFMKVLSDADINPLEYKDTGTSEEIVNRYPGKYINPMTNEYIDISARYLSVFAKSSAFGEKKLLSSGPNRFFPRTGNEEFYFIRSGEQMHYLVFKRNLYIRSILKSEIVKKQ